jgi:membrane protein YqaA with SNARE-associated domain
MVFGSEFLINLANSYGLIGVFVIGFLSSFTLFIPSPAFFVVFLLGPIINPLPLGLAAGLGSAVGELTSYYAGYGVSLAAKKYHSKFARIEKLFQKYNAPLIIFFFSATPLPFDIVGIFCGTVRYPVKRFFLATLAGKAIKFVLIAYAGFYGLEAAEGIFFDYYK